VNVKENTEIEGSDSNSIHLGSSHINFNMRRGDLVELSVGP
jgi:hypothetical protein